MIGMKRGVFITIALCLVMHLSPLWAATTSAHEQDLVERVAHAQTQYGKSSAEHLQSLAQLIRFYDIQRQPEKALPLADRYTQLLAASRGERSPETRLFQRDLVRRYLLLGDRAGAAKAYERQVMVLRDGGSVRDRDLADAEHTLALLLADAGRLAAAEQQFKAAVAALTKAYGGEHRMVAAVLLDWSKMDVLQGGGRQSDKLRDQAQTILARGDLRSGYRPELANNQMVRRLEDDLDRALRTEGFASEAYMQRLMALGQHYEKAGYTGGGLLLAQRSLSMAGLWLPDDAPFQDVLLDMAHKHTALEEHEDALRAYRRYREVLVKLYGEGSTEAARAGYDIALVLANLHRLEAAAAEYEQAVPRLQAALGAKHPQVGLALAHHAGTMSRLADHETAAAKATAAWDILNGDRSLPTAQWLSGLTTVRETLHGGGRHDLAVTVGEAALARARAEFGDGDPRIGAELNDLAVTANAAGSHAKALNWGEDSVARLSRTHGADHPQVAKAMNTLAEAYAGLGQRDKALELLQRSLAITRNAFGPESIELARAQANLALVMDDPVQSVQLLQNSRQIFLRQKDQAEAAKALHNLAAVYATSLNFDKAIEAGKANLEVLAKMYPDGHPALLRGRVLVGMAEFFNAQPDQAIATLQDALARAELGAGTELVESSAQMTLSLAYAYKKQDDLSIAWGKQAVNAHQRWRDVQVVQDAALRDTLARVSRQTYEMVATLLVRQGRIDEAQTILRMLKEGELFETLRGAGGDPRSTRVELTGLERERFSRYYELRSRQAGLATERRNLENKRTAQGINAAEAKRLDEITTQLMPVAAQAMRTFLKRLETEMAASPGKAVQNASSVARETGSLRKTVDVLAKVEPAAKAVGLQYVVSEDTLTIILSPPGAPPIAHQRAIKRPDLYRNIQIALLQISDAKGDLQFYKPTLQSLHALLIEDIRPDLEKLGARTLMLSLDSELRLLPFAALMDKQGRYLIEDYALALYNEAAGNEPQHSSLGKTRVVAMGLSRAVDGLPALAHVPDELTRVKKFAGGDGAIYLNEDFNRPRFDATLGRSSQSMFNVLHIASHFRFQYGSPASSWLYLGDKSRLSLLDLANSDVSLKGFDLVTYSACDTGKGGGRDQSGKIMESLGAITQRKGAQAVLASLWRVADHSTAMLMADFYKQRGQGLTNKAEALRLAQLGMIHGKDNHSGQGSWAHPYHWAPFVVMGNWR